MRKTELASDASAGANVAPSVDNNDGFAASDYIVIRQEGSEKAELQQVSSVSGNGSITAGTLKFDHKTSRYATRYRSNYYGKARGNETKRVSY
jgi:hypothetical protein